MFVITAVRRALAVNPNSIPVGERENATLEAHGIAQPAIRSYFTWRRSSMLFVALCSLLSACLTIYRENTETGKRFDVMETITEHFPIDELDEQEECDEASADEASEPEEDESEEEEEDEPETTFGLFTDAVQLVAMHSLPMAALAVIFFWTRFQLTYRIMVAAFMFSFMFPLLLALCPWSWWGYVEPDYSLQKQPVQYVGMMAEGLLEGATYLVTLLPIVLSLVPGVQRASIRVKMLLPQSVLPGWFLVVASPFYAMFLFVVFVAINQVDTQPLFFAGMLLFLSAPLTYVVKADVVTRPLASEADYRRIRGVQRIVGAMTSLAGILLVTYLATNQVMSVRLLGVDPEASLVVPLDLVAMLLETLSRSVFMTVLGADLFMRMNLTAWKNAREFAGTPEAENYDRVMGEFERVS